MDEVNPLRKSGLTPLETFPNGVKKLLIISSDSNLKEVLNFCFDGWGYEVFLFDDIGDEITTIKKISPDIIVLDIQSARKDQLKICKILKDDFATAFIPVIVLINKRHLRSHLLSLKQGVDDYLIKPPDPLDLRIRVEMAMRRSTYSFYTNALTGLPGIKFIEEILAERLHKRISFSFGYLDIDNFKYFNDLYGYLKGDRVIRQTAYILYSTIKKIGSEGDFVGHIGGDDFVFITTLKRYRDICQHIITLFERVVSLHYYPEDRKRGFIVARDRSRNIKKIPLMSVSIAVVNITSDTNISNLIEINDRLAEIKRYLKNISGSKFMADRRSAKDTTVTPEVYERDTYTETPKLLGQILIDKKVITPEQLEEALEIHWRQGLSLGEVLREMGVLKEEELKEALRLQQSKPSTHPML